MTVYIEYVLLDNFVIDYLLLKATFATTGKKYSKGRLFLCAFLGAVIALLYPLLKVNQIILTAVKVLSGLLIILISNKFEKVKEYYIHTVLFFTYTFLTGGAIIGVFGVLGIDYSTEVSVALMIIPVYILISCCICVIKYIYRRKDVMSSVVEVEITAFDVSVKGRGFFDTGNAVYDQDSPVVFCSTRFASGLIKDNFSKIRLKKIIINTVNGQSEKYALKTDVIKIYKGTNVNIHYNITLCITSDVGEGYDVILHPAFLEKESYEDIKKVKSAY